MAELTQALQAKIVDLADRLGWELAVLFGSTAREGEGRDLDIAVQASRDIDLFTQGGWQAELEALADPTSVDLVLITDAMSPLTRFEIFREGRCLFEQQAGLFDREFDRAFFLYADSEWLRRQAGKALRGDD